MRWWGPKIAFPGSVFCFLIVALILINYYLSLKSLHFEFMLTAHMGILIAQQ